MTFASDQHPFLSLDGLWDFAFLGSIDPLTFDPANLPTAWEKMPVPAAFDALPDYAGRRGAAVYRKQLAIPAGCPARLEFGAVSMWTRVFIDGALAREHACGYAPFSVEAPPAAHADRYLVVLVDNRFDFGRVPMHDRPFDFYQYGGILRSAALRILPARGPWIAAVRVTPTAGYREGEVAVDVLLGGPAMEGVTFRAQFDDAPPQDCPTADCADGRARFTLRVPAAQVWSPATPHLHRLRVALLDESGRPLDDAAVRFGLRRIEARAGALWLNGERLTLRGYNRHEWHPNYGPCTPTLQMVADLQLLRDLGCNFIRGAHYPQDRRFLDLCDEYGFLVWEENLGWGQREAVLTDAKFQRDHAETLRAMIEASFNHPSIIIWGFLNEAGTDEEYCRALFEGTVRAIRALDPSRLVSYASMFVFDDKYFDLVDLISINIYPGWYNCEDDDQPLELIAPFMRRCFESIDARGFADKPVLVSEIGAEGLYGWHDAHGDFFTEEHQAEYLRRACEAALSDERCSGIALWHFSDVRTYGAGLSLKRPRTFNNKGTLDEYRRPKLAYRVVQEIFQRAARDGR